MDCLVEMQHITKEFPGVTALDDVNFDLLSGEVHILLGENGAGKSTLMKILSGVYEPTDGKIVLGNKEYERLTPRQSVENGISIIYQELSLANQLSIAENIYMGCLPLKKVLSKKIIDYKKIRENTTELLKTIGLSRDPQTPVGNLSVSEKQQVEIARAISKNARIIIMDEPTSSLTVEETGKLFEIIHKLKKSGVGIIYISHKLDEIKKIGDRVSVLKDGKYIGTKKTAEVEIDTVISMMVGRELKAKYQSAGSHHREGKKVIFSVKNLTRKDGRVKNVSFDLYENEILGFSGMVGSGRTELMTAIFRAEEIEKGELYLQGKKLELKNPYQAVKNGIALVTEDRRELGFFHNFELWKNISIIPLIKDSKLGGLWGLLDTKREKETAKKAKEDLKIKCSSINQHVSDLSGGNQQKVIVGKWLAAEQDLIIFDEPTKGNDVGAKVEMYNIMRSLADKGKGIIMVSSELPELLSVCDRIVVFREGGIRAILNSEDATEEKIVSYAASNN